MELDRIKFDGLRHKMPSGKEIVPHAGQSAWVYGYGRPASETEELRQLYSAMGRGDEEADKQAFGRLCEFIAEEVDRWDLVNWRTGEAYPQPTNGDAVAMMPDPALAYLINKLLGIETEGEEPNESEGLPDG